MIVVVSFMSGDRCIPCGRQGEHGRYFKAVLSFSIESVGILWREPINIYIGEHCRSWHIPKHAELKSVFPSTRSRTSQSKNERCRLHSGLCLAQGRGACVWKVRVAGRNILGQVQTVKRWRTGTPLGMLRFHQQFTEEKDGALQRCVNIRVCS